MLRPPPHGRTASRSSAEIYAGLAWAYWNYVNIGAEQEEGDRPDCPRIVFRGVGSKPGDLVEGGERFRSVGLGRS